MLTTVISRYMELPIDWYHSLPPNTRLSLQNNSPLKQCSIQFKGSRQNGLVSVVITTLVAFITCCICR